MKFYTCTIFLQGASKNLITNTESRIFWLSLVVCQVFWIVFFFGTLFTLKFKWFVSMNKPKYFINCSLHTQWYTLIYSMLYQLRNTMLWKATQYSGREKRCVHVCMLYIADGCMCGNCSKWCQFIWLCEMQVGIKEKDRQLSF